MITDASLENVANGIVIIIVGLLSWLGINRGRKTKEKEEAPRQVELAGAVIDGKRADQIIEALDRNTAALRIHAEAVFEVRAVVREAKNELRTMTTEIIRSQK